MYAQHAHVLRYVGGTYIVFNLMNEYMSIG